MCEVSDLLLEAEAQGRAWGKQGNDGRIWCDFAFQRLADRNPSLRSSLVEAWLRGWKRGSKIGL